MKLWYDVGKIAKKEREQKNNAKFSHFNLKSAIDSRSITNPWKIHSVTVVRKLVIYGKKNKV